MFASLILPNSDLFLLLRAQVYFLIALQCGEEESLAVRDARQKSCEKRSRSMRICYSVTPASACLNFCNTARLRGAKWVAAKIKANKGIVGDATDRTNLFSELAQRTDSTLVFQRGNVAVFWKPRS